MQDVEKLLKGTVEELDKLLAQAREQLRIKRGIPTAEERQLRHCRQSTRPRPPKQLDQQRFGLIVPMLPV